MCTACGSSGISLACALPLLGELLLQWLLIKCELIGQCAILLLQLGDLSLQSADLLLCNAECLLVDLLVTLLLPLELQVEGDGHTQEDDTERAGGHDDEQGHLIHRGNSVTWNTMAWKYVEV